MTFLAVRKHKKSPGKGLDCDYLFEKKALLEVVVFCHDLMYYFQSVCLDVFLEHDRRRVPGDLHDVVYVHSAEVHQGRSCAPCSMREYQLVLGYHLLDVAPAFRNRHADRFDNPCEPGYFLDIVVDKLVRKTWDVIVVLLQDLQQGGRTGNRHLCAGLLLGDIDDLYF